MSHNFFAMETKTEKAIKSFKSGYNCAQSVVAAFSNDLGFDEHLSNSISCGFGGGMGRLQEKCGAVTGAFMVLGVYNCNNSPDNLTRKNNTYAMVRQFDEKFTTIYKTTTCKELLKCDLQSEDGHQFAKENGLFEKVCEKCLRDAVAIVEELIVQDKR